MSVTFTVDYDESDVRGWVITNADGWAVRSFGTYQEAADAFPVNGFLDGYTIEALQPNWPSVNVSNGNATYVLFHLGMLDVGDTELYGSCDPNVLELEVLEVLASDASVEAPSFEERGEGGAHLIEGGRREGYVQDICSRLLPVIKVARDLGRAVVWA